MNIVEKYYIKKASVGQSDEFYTQIENRDLAILKKAQAYIFIAPTVTIGFVWLLNKLRYELLMSQHFFYMIKKYQDKMQSKYSRKKTTETKEDLNPKTNDAEETRNLYKDIE